MAPVFAVGAPCAYAANGSEVSSLLQTVPPPSCDHRAVGIMHQPGHMGQGAAVRHRTRNPVPAPKFARSLTRCTEISEGSVMDVAHGEMVEAELTPAGAKRSAWRGASTTRNKPNATGPSRRTKIPATTSPSYEEVDFWVPRQSPGAKSGDRRPRRAASPSDSTRARTAS